MHSCFWASCGRFQWGHLRLERMRSCLLASCSRFLCGYYSASSGCTLVCGLLAAAFSLDTTPPRADALLFVGFLRPLSLRILLSLERTHSCLWASCGRFLFEYFSRSSGRTLACGLPAAAFSSGSSGCTLACGLPAAAFSPDTTPPRADAPLLVGFLRPLSLRILLCPKRTHSCLWASCDRFLCGYYFAPSGHTLARGLPAAAFTANTSPKGPLPASLPPCFSVPPLSNLLRLLPVPCFPATLILNH